MIKLLIKDENFIYRGMPWTELFYFKDVVHCGPVDFTSIEIVVHDENRAPLFENQIDMSERQLYVLIETVNTDNFGHFIWESMVFLKQLIRIKNKFPGVKFLLKNEHEFKTKILNHHEMPWTTKIDNPSNYVGILPPITSLNTNKNYLYYKDLLESFHHEIHRTDISEFDKDLQFVYFPRHLSKGNFPYPEQRTVVADEIEQFVRSQPNSVVFSSENNLDWGAEIDLVKRCKILIVPDGSAAAVLGFYANNSVIISLGSLLIPSGVGRFEKCEVHYRLIQKCNRVFFVTGKNNNYTMNDIMPIITRSVHLA